MQYREKLNLCIKLFIHNFLEKHPESDPVSHATLENFKLYVDSAYYDQNSKTYDEKCSYAVFTFAGISLNFTGEVNIKFEEKFGRVDFEKWINTSLQILQSGRIEESKKFNVDNFIAIDVDEVLLKKSDIFTDEWRVKAGILDKMLNKNISFTN